MAEWEIDLYTNDIHPDSDLDNLKRDTWTPFPNYALALPRYSRLDGTYENADVIVGEIGYMSNSISNDNGRFETPPVISMEFVRKKISKGVNFIFNPVSGDYCNDLTINWYNGDRLIHSADYEPDAAEYYAAANVGAFTRLEVIFRGTSKPYRRLWLARMINNRLMEGSGLVITYGDVAYGGKENTVIVTDDAKEKTDVDLLLDNSISDFPNYALCLPRYSKLDGTYVNVPEDPTDIAFISRQISNASGIFSDPPSITFNIAQVIGSVGIELFFDQVSEDYCSEVNIKWYLEGTLIHDETFEPDAYDYFCHYNCEYYDRLVITFMKTSKPYRPILLRGFYYGIGRVFTKKEITKCTVFQEISPIGQSLPANTLNFTVRNEGLEFRVERNQTLNVSFDGQIIGDFYLKTAERANQYIYTFKCEDIKMILDNSTHVGGFYHDVSIETVIRDEIFAGIDVEVYIDDSVNETLLNGWLPYDTRRNNLAQILFAAGAIMDVSFGEGVYIYKYDKTLSAASISSSQTYYGKTKVKNDDVISGVELTVHSWIAKQDITELYNGIVSGDALITFSDPQYDLSITGGTILDSGDNYAVIRGTGESVVLSGKGYDHQEKVISKENAYIYNNKKVAKADNTTLVTEENSEDVLDRLYDFYSNNQTVNSSILLENIELSNIVRMETFDGSKQGIVQSLNMTFTGEVKAEVSVKCLT